MSHAVDFNDASANGEVQNPHDDEPPPSKPASPPDTKSSSPNVDDKPQASSRNAAQPPIKPPHLGKLTPEEAATSKRRFAESIKDTDDADKAYNQLPGSDGGKRIGVDLSRELNPDYAAEVKRGDLRPKDATDGVANDYFNGRVGRELSNRGDRKTVLFTAGGFGAGKSTSSGGHSADLVIDSTLGSWNWTKQQIQQALDNGWEVQVQHTGHSVWLAPVCWSVPWTKVVPLGFQIPQPTTSNHRPMP